MTIRKIIAICYIAVLSVSSGCSRELEQIKVGVYGPFTGGTALIGVSMRNGVQLAADEINAAGGIMVGGTKKPLGLLFRDDESKNEKGSQIMQEFLEKEKVVAVLGPANTGVADASTKLSNEMKTPHLINISSGAKINELFAKFPDNYVFRYAATDELMCETVIAEIVERRGIRKIALLCDNTNYGQNARLKVEAALDKRQLKALYTGKFSIKDTDMMPQLAEAKAAGAEALILYGIGPELASTVLSLKKAAWQPKAIGGTWAFSMPNFLTSAGAGSEGVLVPQSFIVTPSLGTRAAAFVAAYQKRFNETPINVPVAASQGYDSVYLLKQAMEQAGTTDGAAVKAALENLEKPFDGIVGTFAKPYSATDHEAIKQVQLGVIHEQRIMPLSATSKP